MKEHYLLKKLFLYFVPVILVQIVLCIIDKRLLFFSIFDNNFDNIRRTYIVAELFISYVLIPLYMVITNMGFNMKNEVQYFFSDIPLLFLSIVNANIIRSMLFIILDKFMKISDISFLIEFTMLLIPETILLSMFGYIGSQIIKSENYN